MKFQGIDIADKSKISEMPVCIIDEIIKLQHGIYILFDMGNAQLLSACDEMPVCSILPFKRKYL